MPTFYIWNDSIKIFFYIPSRCQTICMTCLLFILFLFSSSFSVQVVTMIGQIFLILLVSTAYPFPLMERPAVVYPNIVCTKCPLPLMCIGVEGGKEECVKGEWNTDFMFWCFDVLDSWNIVALDEFTTTTTTSKPVTTNEHELKVVQITNNYLFEFTMGGVGLLTFGVSYSL